LQLEYGEEIWQQVMEKVGCKFAVFSTHHIYPDNLMANLATACAMITGEGATTDHFIQFFGRCFVRFFSNFGYRHSIAEERKTFRLYTMHVYSAHSIRKTITIILN
jgi:guanylate cyclase